MADDQRQYASRRTVLKSTGVAATVALAGCSGGDGGSQPEDTPSNGTSGGNTTTAANEQFPSEPLRVIVPYSPGGTGDTYSRLYTPPLEDELGVEVNIENIPGARAMRGIRELVTADPDGYTVGYATLPTNSITALVSGDDSVPWSDMTGVTVFNQAPIHLCVNTEDGVEDFSDLQTRFAEGEMETIGMYQLGGGQHLAMLELKQRGYLEYDRLVEYGTGPERTAALVRGEVDAAPTTNQAAATTDEIEPVLTIGPKADEFPDVENDQELFDESIPGGFNARGLAGPAGLDLERRQTIAEGMEAALQSDAVQGPAERTGLQLQFHGGPEYHDDIISDMFNINQESIDALDAALE